MSRVEVRCDILGAMPTIEFETTIDAPVPEVWDWHEDVLTALPALSPPASAVRVESAELPVRVGSRIVVRAKGPAGIPIRMVARIVEHVPPGADGAAARFVDEQESGPFAFWRHEHLFSAIDGNSTRAIDRVTYRVRFRSLGRLADLLFVRRQVDSMFAHRHAVLRRTFDHSRHACETHGDRAGS